MQLEDIPYSEPDDVVPDSLFSVPGFFVVFFRFRSRFRFAVVIIFACRVRTARHKSGAFFRKRQVSKGKSFMCSLRISATFWLVLSSITRPVKGQTLFVGVFGSESCAWLARIPSSSIFIDRSRMHSDLDLEACEPPSVRSFFSSKKIKKKIHKWVLINPSHLIYPLLSANAVVFGTHYLRGKYKEWGVERNSNTRS